MRKVPLLALIFCFLCVSGMLLMSDTHNNEPIVFDGFNVWDFYVPPLPSKIHPREKPAALLPMRALQDEFEKVRLTYYEIELGDSYRCFITAYCAEECGWNYATSSGAICHRSSEANRYEPSTCAIDRAYFSYNTLFYVPSEDRVYIAEDTGAFRGLWLDLYQDSMGDVISYNTRYETIYTCEIVQKSVPAYYYNIHKYIREAFKNECRSGFESH